MKTFLSNNRVVITAFISAIILCLQQFLSAASIDYRVFGFALLTALLGVAANEWKGKGLSILGIIGNLAGVFINIQQSGTFTWNEFILASMVAILTAINAGLSPVPTLNDIVSKK